MKMLYNGFSKVSFCVVNDVVYCAEMISGFYYVIHIHCTVCHPNSIGLKYIACLVMRQPAAFDMVGVICQVNLDAVVDATFCFSAFLFSENP